MREQVILRDRHCVFPWCGRDARTCRPRPHHRRTSHPTRRTPRPDQPAEPRTTLPATPPRQDLHRVDLPTRQRRHLRLDVTARRAVPRHGRQHRRARQSLSPARPASLRWWAPPASPTASPLMPMCAHSCGFGALPWSGRDRSSMARSLRPQDYGTRDDRRLGNDGLDGCRGAATDEFWWCPRRTDQAMIRIAGSSRKR